MYRFAITAFAAFCLTAALIAAQEKADKAPSLDDAKTVAEIEAYLEKQTESIQAKVAELAQKQQLDAESIAPFIKSMLASTVAAGEKMLQVAANDSERETAYETLIQGYNQQDQQEKGEKFKQLQKEAGIVEADADFREKMMALLPQVMALETAAQKKQVALLESIEKEGKFPKLVDAVRFQQFAQKSQELGIDFNAEKFEQFKKDLKTWINKAPEEVDPADLVMMAIQAAESEKAAKADPKLAEKTVKEMTAFLQSKECTITDEKKKEVVDQLEGYCRRCVGAELKLYGKTLDDKDFDWASFRGKYVLVKFTASWCGPCKGEIPGMLKAWEKYHEKGLEIVSVYVMDNLDNAKKAVESEKLPWTILSEELTEKAGQPAQKTTYNIQGVPTMLLIDKEGKVMATEVRGQVLQKKLAEIFGN